MKLSAIKNVVTSKAGRQLLTVQKNSPKLLFGAGIVGVVATAVLASRATLKVDGVLDGHAKKLVNINITNHVDYSEDDRQKDKVILYVQTAMRLTKLYAPAVTIGVVSIFCLTSSHNILSQRNAGLAAAYAALDKGFNEYRERVLKDVGAEKEREYRYETETREFVEETNKGQKITHEQRVSGDPSIYAKIFGRDTTQNWNAESAYNMIFLRAQQNYANHLLQSRGHVMLNDIYDALGLDRTPAGAVVGWVKDHGDNYIDFGIFDRELEPKHAAFFTGREENLWLDFNVDGVVYEMI